MKKRFQINGLGEFEVPISKLGPDSAFKTLVFVAGSRQDQASQKFYPFESTT
jgi:hypothetical protein